MHPQFTKARLELSKEAYARETDRKARSVDQFSTLLAVHTFGCALAAYYVSNLPYKAGYMALCGFLIPAVVGAVAGVLGLIRIGSLLFFGKLFLRFRDAKTFDNNLAAAAADYPGKEYDEALVSELETQMLAQYLEMTVDNRRQNDARDKVYHESMQCAVIAILFLLLAAPGFFHCRTIVEAVPVTGKTLTP